MKAEIEERAWRERRTQTAEVLCLLEIGLEVARERDARIFNRRKTDKQRADDEANRRRAEDRRETEAA